jgi:uncharacterized protein YcfJ
MGLEMAEALVAVGSGPARERIETARERTVRVNRTAPRPEEDAAPVFGASEQNGAAGLGVAGKELGGGDAQPA